MQPFTVQLVDLTLMQFTNWRWSWRGMIVTGLIAPVLMTACWAFSPPDTARLRSATC